MDEDNRVDTGEGKSPWFQSRVQVLVKSLQGQQRGWSSAGRQSLTSRLQQYSPTPLRRLRRLFSSSSEPELREEGCSTQSSSQQKHEDGVPKVEHQLEEPAEGHENQISGGEFGKAVKEAQSEEESDVEKDEVGKYTANIVAKDVAMVGETGSKWQLELPSSSTSGGVATTRKSPVTVQEWVDSIPLSQQRSEDDVEQIPVEDDEDHLGLGAEAGQLYGICPAVTIVSPEHEDAAAASAKRNIQPCPPRASLLRDLSLQSDATSHTGSHGSSVESYIGSRRADSQDLMSGLGFGSQRSGMDAEVSRIPRRFLQPSKVKGVAIDDFLRYQHDLMETFETGFSGYRGLTGSANTMPSVIVAKIMEKLREHERENCRSPVSTSAPSTPPPEAVASKKFGDAALQVMKHKTLTSSLSVLNPDNRRYLDSQGGKSPEVPRKRMIIGQRSYTFGYDGDLIEMEPSLPKSKPVAGGSDYTKPLPKMLSHKDTLLSCGTSLSLTSIDSDSDLDDDRSSNHGVQTCDIPVSGTSSTSPLSPLTSNTVHLGNFSTSSPLEPHSSGDSFSEVLSEINHKGVAQRKPHLERCIEKRMSSTSISSWESEGSVLNPHLHPRLQVSETKCNLSGGGAFTEEDKLKLNKNFSHLFVGSDSKRLSHPLRRCESINKNFEIKAEFSGDKLPDLSLRQAGDNEAQMAPSNQPLCSGSSDASVSQNLAIGGKLPLAAKKNVLDTPHLQQHALYRQNAVKRAPRHNNNNNDILRQSDGVFLESEPDVNVMVKEPSPEQVAKRCLQRRGYLRRQSRVTEEDSGDTIDVDSEPCVTGLMAEPQVEHSTNVNLKASENTEKDA